MTSDSPDHALVVRAHPDEDADVCGDTGLIQHCGDELFIALVDGLGHGSEAHNVAVVARKYLEKASRKVNLIDIMQGLHKHLKGTRCVVAAVCRLNQQSGLLKYVGVGNITAKIFASSPVTFVPREGIVGYIMGTLREETLILSKGTILVLHSDGIPAHLDLSGVLKRKQSSAQALADSLVREFGKEDDDVSCIVVKI
jgi:serine phosphatase RsbU (regulator of sigma subunit)